MITRTFRLNPKFDVLLNEESEKQGLSVSNILNQMIEQHVLITKHSKGIPSITISNRMFESLLGHISDEDLIEVAKNIGHILPEEELLQRGKRLDISNALWFLETIQGNYYNWFHVTNNFVGTEEIVHLSHQLSGKWSVYLTSYINELFKSILNVEPRIETRTNSITAYFPKSRIQLIQNKIQQNV